MSEQQRLLAVENLQVTFDIMPRNAWPWTRPQPLKAVNNVSFTLNAVSYTHLTLPTKRIV